MSHIEKTYKQLWLVDDDGNRYNIADWLVKQLKKTKAKPAPTIESKVEADAKTDN